MESQNDPTLMGLPLELQHIVCTFLEKADLLSLRLVSRCFATVTVTPLSKRLDRLQNIPVLITREGLQIFRGICQTPEFLEKMESVRFIGEVERAIGCLLNPKRFSLSATQMMEAIQFGLEQKALVASESVAAELLADALRLLKDAPNIRRVNLGFDTVYYRSGQACGMRAIFRKLGLNATLQASFGAEGNEYVPRDVHHNIPIPLRALKASGFDQKVVRIYIDPYYGIVTRTPFLDPEFWNVVDIDCLQKLKISRHTELKRTAERDWAWVSPCLRSAARIDNLSLTGCRAPRECTKCPHERYRRYKNCVAPGKGCKGCGAITRTLASTTFPNLQKLKLEHLLLSEEILKSLLNACKPTLTSIRLCNIELECGTWRSIFELLKEAGELERVYLRSLYQELSGATGDTETGKHEVAVWTKNDVATFLDQVVAGFAAVLIYPDAINAKLAFVEVRFPCGYTDPFLRRYSGMEWVSLHIPLHYSDGA
ncbi:hypothetical protein K458DRAFT_466798 [Lentithecium fluviatile CBS 122367]|uniref:F-box domain-containing protein n=1 Tax=Lentithecium fluviatile CBS 122367 TaxID=1168545 RepID=A0A6G1IGM2_9PLEO|nr:hypothetical protein K458DRAFT_466798 [Lentithecium fluviatile CBS 122367]